MGIRLGLCQTRVTRDKGENLRLAEAALRTGGRPANLALLPRCSTAPRKPLLPPLRGARGDLAVPGRHGPELGLCLPGAL